MPTTAHPTHEALSILLSVCDGARTQDSVGLNKLDAAFFRFEFDASSANDLDLDRAAGRLAKYRRQLGDELVERLREARARFDAHASEAKTLRDEDAPTIYKWSDTHCVVEGVSFARKDHWKDRARTMTGKWCLIWDSAHKKWLVHRSFVATLLASGEFREGDVTASEFKPHAARAVPAAESVVPTFDADEIGTARPLFDYQKDGVKSIVPAIAEPGKGALLADDMGLGKTMQAIATSLVYGEKAIVVAPAGVRLNWVNEVFLNHPTWTVHLLGMRVNPKRMFALFGGNSRRIIADFEAADVIIASYEGLASITTVQTDPELAKYHTMRRMVVGLWADVLKERLCIVDEAHYGKNRGAARTQNVLAVMRTSKRTLAMTGTPLMNRPLELWTLLCGIGRNRDIAPSAQDFKRRYVYGGQHEELHNLLTQGGWFIRRLKSQVLADLPPKVRGDMIVEMPADVERDYTARLNGLRVINGKQASLDCTLAILTDLQTIANKAKVDPIVERCAERAEDGHYTVVQSTRKEPLSLIVGDLIARGVSASAIVGGMAATERQHILQEFEKGTIKVIVTTLAEGINLTRADEVILLDLDWTPAKITQREDRCYRIGQKQKVNVVRVIAAGIDHQKAAVVASKQELITDIIDGGFSDEAQGNANMMEVARRLAADLA